MGIKNIHVVLISTSVLMALVFALWSFKNEHSPWGFTSIGVAIGLIIYGITFLKKAKTL